MSKLNISINIMGKNISKVALHPDQPKIREEKKLKSSLKKRREGGNTLRLNSSSHLGVDYSQSCFSERVVDDS
ncbi:hypothetical protein FGO68_gene6040 [Halteria grandinella]|uniref:Uncharacterized protein n=1 Tax=Halteria grandinella TaxID=5974 RepID=A0A8J8SVY1_HALGN|nr:hypothetical protein FGO68_gene6040 [Halteria grandinella]